MNEWMDGLLDLESVKSEELFFKLGEVDEKPSSSSAAFLRCW